MPFSLPGKWTPLPWTTRKSVSLSQSGQGLSYICESGDETPVIRTQPQETPQLVFVVQSWRALHSVHLLRVRRYS
jgi:hypothetical protein